jgi:hypothetical protein
MVLAARNRDSDSGVRRAAAYLTIPRGYDGDLRWSAGDVLEYSDGRTFAFAAEVLRFLEGFASRRPLIAFAHILQLLRLLRPVPETLPPAPPFAVLRAAFGQSRRDFRNTGAFAALLCRDVPSSPQPPTAEDLGRWLSVRQAGAGGTPAGVGEMPPLAPPAFEARVQRQLAAHSLEEMVHWFSHGSGPVHDEGDSLIRLLQDQRQPTLEGILAEVTQRQRLSGAVPFVQQLVSALTLPPRRLAPPELPAGGYADVATRGHLEQVLPSQLAYDDLEFVRRLAQRELLYFRREDPHVRTREDLVVLLDQGVRTWGRVRLLLSAAVFALGRLCQRRVLPLLIGVTSTKGELYDPLKTPAEELGQLLEASDLGANPGLALERVLAVPADTGRDVVLLTHPRNLSEADVIAAARTTKAGHRLFALAADDSGEVRWCELRHGAVVPLARFQADLDRPALPAVPPAERPWRGDVEPIPFPFAFGVGGTGDMVFAFDAAGEWILTAAQDGMLFATRTDGSGTEILPRGLIDGKVITHVQKVLGVARGFVVTSCYPCPVALRYDFAERTCTAHRFAPAGGGAPNWWYLRWPHTLVCSVQDEPECLHLSTGSRECLPAAKALLGTTRTPSLDSSPIARLHLPLQESSGGPEGAASWPKLGFLSQSGTLAVVSVRPLWEDFSPEANGQPALAGAKLLDASCQGQTLAALFNSSPGNTCKLRLFRGPQGVPLAEFHQPHGLRRFALSTDGRLLARQVRSSQVEVRDVVAGGPPLALTPRGRYHHDARLQLGEFWLTILIDKTLHLVRWDHSRLKCTVGCGGATSFAGCEMGGGIGLGPWDRARPGQLPPWLPASADGRFRAAAWSNLVAVVDRYSQVALFDHTGTLVCMVFAFRQQLAAWLPDGTCFGPESLLGRQPTPGAAEKIGQALAEASEKGERLAP